MCLIHLAFLCFIVSRMFLPPVTVCTLDIQYNTRMLRRVIWYNCCKVSEDPVASIIMIHYDLNLPIPMIVRTKAWV